MNANSGGLDDGAGDGDGALAIPQRMKHHGQRLNDRGLIKQLLRERVGGDVEQGGGGGLNDGATEIPSGKTEEQGDTTGEGDDAEYSFREGGRNDRTNVRIQYKLIVEDDDENFPQFSLKYWPDDNDDSSQLTMRERVDNQQQWSLARFISKTGKILHAVRRRMMGEREIFTSEVALAHSNLESQGRARAVDGGYYSPPIPGLVFIMEGNGGRTLVATFTLIGCGMDRIPENSLNALIIESGLWTGLPRCLASRHDWNNPRGSGLVIIPLSDASAEDKKLFEQREAVGHGVIQRELLMQALKRLKSALDLSCPYVASHLYLAHSTTDERGIQRPEADQILIGVFTRGDDVCAPLPNGLGKWNRTTPNGVGLEGLVRVVKLDSDQKQRFLSENGYSSVDKIVPNVVEWTRVMDAYSEAMASDRPTYYVKDREGILLNRGEPFSSITEFVERVNGREFRTQRINILREEINRKNLGATRGRKPKWENTDRTQHGEATWIAPNGNQYTISSRPFQTT